MAQSSDETARAPIPRISLSLRPLAAITGSCCPSRWLVEQSQVELVPLLPDGFLAAVPAKLVPLAETGRACQPESLSQQGFSAE